MQQSLFGVSIPRRYAKNSGNWGECRSSKKVSIPRRYAKNTGNRNTGDCNTGFQSLVGTLKTRHMKKMLFQVYVIKDFISVNKPKIVLIIIVLTLKIKLLKCLHSVKL